jgi:hypothetical protein
MISAAVIAFQLALMQLLSLVQWYHFGSMIISVALLGFGAAGTCLSLLRSRLMRHFDPGAYPALLPGAPLRSRPPSRPDGGGADAFQHPAG